MGIIAGLAAGFGATWMLGLNVAHFDLFLAAGLIALTGLIDDRAGGLPALVRLAAQIVAAAVIVFQSGGLSNLPLPAPLDIQLGVLAKPVALLWIVGVTNLYNFLDGIDGFAGLQGVIAGLAIAVIGGGGGFPRRAWHWQELFDPGVQLAPGADIHGRCRIGHRGVHHCRASFSANTCGSR
jgi:UDP-N-acetylmuramyl pentapeptide phosphotransferase/UDP-N-acetylglucosamine-1-phosphate transferase